AQRATSSWNGAPSVCTGADATPKCMAIDVNLPRGLDLQLEATQVLLPHVAQDRIRDERADRPTEEPREAQALAPRELRASAAPPGEREARRALHRTLVGDAHLAARRPFGDRHHVACVQRPHS